jgi:glyoxalase family protein
MHPTPDATGPNHAPANEPVLGLHHITAMAADPQRNHDFYVGVLGLRLVKRSVNQDDPTTYHLFYADDEGTPGSDLTFFPWPHLPPARKGVGNASEVMLAIPVGSATGWRERLLEHGLAVEGPMLRFGETTLTLRDPDGLELALVESDDPRDFHPWQRGPVPVEQQIRGLHGVRLLERDLGPSHAFLHTTLGFETAGEEGGWHRYALPGDRLGGSGRFLDLQEIPGGRLGAWGTGGVHHVAWSVRDGEHQVELQRRLAAAGRNPSPVIDRFWFRSVYFKEPGGVLFELATLGPGFAIDEASEHLGERLILPPRFEPLRPHIEAALPPLDTERIRQEA